MAHPYKTIEHAYQTLPDNTTGYTINFRGYQKLTTTILDNHTTTIRADYPGAGIIDGAAYNEVTQQYEPTHSLIWCDAYTNLTLWNMGVGAGQFLYRQESTYTQYSTYASLLGAGRANYAAYVGNANGVYGFASSPVRSYNCALWRGGIGGVNNIGSVYASVRKCSGTLATLNQASTSCTMYDGRLNVNITGSHGNATTNPTLQKCLFAKWDIFIGVKTQTFTECYFASDCNFYIYTSSKYYKIVLGDATAEIACTLDNVALTCTVDGVATIKAACEAVISNYNVTNTKFNNCTWGTQDSSQLFVDPDHYNLALKDGCEAILGDKGYFGAIAPARHIKFLQNSDGQLWAFDHRTIDGDCLAISETGELMVNLNSTDDGAIFSKVIQIDPSKLQFDGIEALIQTKKNSEGFVLAQRKYFLGDFVSKNTDLAVGTYIVVGDYAVTYGTHTVTPEEGESYQEETLYQPMDVFEVLESDENKQFNSEGTTKLVRELLDPNQVDGIYIRCRSMIYKFVTPQDTLVEGATYINSGKDPITYAGRTIVAGESFVCAQGATSFAHATDENYKIGVLWDDPELPTSEWIFYGLQGRAFVSKSHGNITRSDNGMPESSGNPRAWNTSTSLNIQGTATNINQPYVQVAIFVTNLRNVDE